MPRLSLFGLTLSLGGCLVLGLCSCGRPAVVAPEDSASPDGPTRHGTVARGKTTGDEGTGEPFRLPDDAGGKLLARVLPPAHGQRPLPDHVRGPRRTPTSARLAAPVSPLSPANTSLPQLPASRKRDSLLPRLVVEEALGGRNQVPVPPSKVALPAGNRMQVPSLDVNRPIPVPILAQPVPDLASLEDPTTEASTAAVQTARMPQRTQPAAFLRLRLPDPYEYRGAVGVLVSPENPAPPRGTPQRP